MANVTAHTDRKDPALAVEWLDDRLRILDQSELPLEQRFIEIFDYRDVALAIKEMKVRGAPAIGIAAAYGIALAAQNIKCTGINDLSNSLNQIMKEFASTRPTAVNLFRALERMQRASAGDSIPSIQKALLDQARQIHCEEMEATREISSLGAELIHDGFTVLTHCNAGPLATAGYGTALGAIIAASDQGKRINVVVTETRPLLQGARLTAWELKQKDIPITLITDSMSGYFMNRSKIDCVIVGADRIAANGDVANKIGTYVLAVLAQENAIPFYVAAPTSTIDLSLPTGDMIPVEERSSREITHLQGIPLAPEGVKAANPAFDITPNRYISAIITERGIIKGEYRREFAKIAPEEQTGR